MVVLELTTHIVRVKNSRLVLPKCLLTSWTIPGRKVVFNRSYFD